MGSLKKIGGKRYEAHVVSVSKTKALKIKASLKKKHKGIRVRVQRTPTRARAKHVKGQQYDVWRTPRRRKSY